jgi:type IV pilus assembly protein PilA
MKNLMKKIRKSNKGFTLVELIIVVAIIAILSAVVAPQYIKYVEKSRAAADADTFGAVVQAVNVLVADGTITTAETFTWADAGSVTSTGGHADEVLALTGTVPAQKSAKAQAQDNTVAVTFDATTKQPTVTVTPAGYTAWGN